MIICKTNAELELMREAGRIVANTHKLLKEAIKPGVTTLQLDQLAEQYILSQDAFPSFKGYNGYPASICASVNDELVHGIPGQRKLKDGDIISIDVGAYFCGFHGDSAWTYPVGHVSPVAQKLLEVTENALYKGLSVLKSGIRLYAVSEEIHGLVEQHGFSIVEEYVGHGIGNKLHEYPQIPNNRQTSRGPRLKTGMTLAIEPMVNVGQRYVKTLDDGWTVVTVDHSLCAHFEHTVVVTDDGYEILTLP